MTSTAHTPRLHHLDAVRAFALLLGIVFHASVSFMPVAAGWAVMDVSTSPLVSAFIVISHSFRMEVFFLIAGFFSHLAFHRSGAGAFLTSRFIRIVVPFVIGWFILRPLVVSGWIMGYESLRGDVDVWEGLRGGCQSLATLPEDILTGTHLWFLYYLALITVAALAGRALIRSTGPWHARLTQQADAMLARLAGSRFSLLVVVVPTAGVLWFMRGWGMDTPDDSLRPHLPVMLIYGGFFAFGWMLHRAPELVARFARPTAWRWILAGTACAATVLLSIIQADPSHPHYMTARVGYTVSYAVMMWSLVLLTIGVFQRLCRRPSPFVRYVADSSYWMYLIHLPVVVWLQVAVAEVPLHWSIKLVGISAATIVVALLSYDLFVRSTILGRILNGRRRDRAIFVGMPETRVRTTAAG